MATKMRNLMAIVDETVLAEARVVPGVGRRKVDRNPPIVPSIKADWGFWGAAVKFREDYRATNAEEPEWTVAVIWNEVIKQAQEMTGTVAGRSFSPERIRDWLDTKDGRRLMDTLSVRLPADAASVPEAVSRALKWNYPFPQNLRNAITDVHMNNLVWR